MSISAALPDVGRRIKARVNALFFWRMPMSGTRRWVRLSAYILMSGLLGAWLVACSGAAAGGNGTTTTVRAGETALSALHWCGKPFMIFRDEGAPATPTANAAATASVAGAATASVTAVVSDGNVTMTPTSVARTITNWAQVKPGLGFSVFLPATLPAGSCLVSASGTLHDPIFGSSFTIGYLLPDHSALSFSEAPLRSRNTAFQCSPSSSSASSSAGGGTPTPRTQQVPVQLCSGAREKTNIVLSARGATASLEKLFQALQPDVNWIPS